MADRVICTVGHGNLVGPGSAREHTLNPMARIERGVPVYDRGSPLELGVD